MSEIYFDNSSTTRPSQAVRDIVLKTMDIDYGNPSSMHQKGVEAEAYLKETQRILSSILKVREKEILFTSGGTESNNWALLETAISKKHDGRTIITTKVEHPAVSEVLKYLEKTYDYRIVKIGTDREGRFDMEAFEEALTEDVVLVSVMFVNNEIGTVMPIPEIGRLIREKAPKALFHVDATQAFGHLRIYPKTMGIDLLSASAHKFHGPKGVGFLYADERVKLKPLILGGGQQMGLRSGTDNVPGVAGMGVAAKEAYDNFEERNAYIRGLRTYLMARLGELDRVVIHGTAEEGMAPHIVHASFIGVGSEVLLHALEDKGIYISAGSACSTHKRAPSATLTALHADRDELSSGVRFSFSEENTKEEIDALMEALKVLLPMLRRYRAK